MITGHLSAQQIQHYAFEKHSCTPQEIEHVEGCSHCSSKIEAYQLIFTTIKTQPPPAFDFDLAQAVIEQLPKSNPLVDSRFFYFILGLAFPTIGVIVYLFRSPLLNLFSGITPLSIYLIITGGLTVLAFLCLESYLTFVKKMKKLNYH